MDERLDEIAAERLVTFLSVPLPAAELDARAAFGFGAIETRAFQIIRTVQDVGTKLLLHVFLDMRTMKKLSGKRTKVGHEFHNSSRPAVWAVFATVTSLFA